MNRKAYALYRIATPFSTFRNAFHISVTALQIWWGQVTNFKILHASLEWLKPESSNFVRL